MTNLLGNNNQPTKKKQADSSIKWRYPEEDDLSKKKVEIEPKKKEDEMMAQKQYVGLKKEVNFIAIFRSIMRTRRLTFSLLFVIIIIVIVGVMYFSKYNHLDIKNDSNDNVNVSEPEPEPEVEPEPEPEVEPEPEPEPEPEIEEPEPEIIILPDTKLVALKGSLVAFRGQTVVYLVEDNGELRLINKRTVVFDNGQSIEEVNTELIYIIHDKFRSVRKGKIVSGRIEYDPRVLLIQEIKPFL